MLVAHRDFPPTPAPPDGVTTKDELASYIASAYFAGIQRGAAEPFPFLLVANYLSNEMIRSGNNPLYQDFLRTEYFLGIALGRGDLFRYKKDGDSFVIDTERHVPLELAKGKGLVMGPIELPCYKFRYTSFVGAISDPQGLQPDTVAFLPIVGLKAMDAFFLGVDKSLWSNKEYFQALYILGLHRLGLCPVLEQMQDVERQFKLDTLSDLLKSKHDKQKRTFLLERAQILGLAGSGEWVQIEGISYISARLIQDLKNITS